MKTKILISIIAISIAIVFSCKKEAETPTGGNKIEIGQSTTDTLSYFTAKVSTTISATGGNEISQHGHCWGTDKEPTIENNKTTLGKLTEPKTYTSELINLTNNTTYYVCSYVTYANGTIYGSEQSIQTLKTGKPIVTTTQVSDVTLYTAVLGGIVQADSGLAVTTRGVCWDTISSFTIANCLDTTVIGNGLGHFTKEISELLFGQDYFVKAFAINEKGISYGEIKEFSTTPINVPVVSTNDISYITTNTAQSGGNVTGEGNGIVAVRGVVWSTNQNPTIENNEGITEDGSGLGIFTSNLTDLQYGILYYVRAYATNEKGTGYGEQKDFQTIALEVPTVSTATPANITTNSAESGGNVTNEGNNPVTVRGIVWSTNQNPTIENNQGITENGSGLGTFVSNLTELQDGTLFYIRAYATNEKGTGYGEQKDIQTITIGAPTVSTTTPTSITPTSAQSGGNVTHNGNSTVTARGVCWSTVTNPTISDNHTIDGTGTGVFTSDITGLTYGTEYYVRAYATNINGTSYGNEVTFTTSPLLPTVNTNNTTNITNNSATSGGNITSNGGASVTSRGVCWSTSSNPTISNNHTSNGTGTGAFTSEITGITGSTQYYVRAYATNSEGTSYGNEMTFTTISDPEAPIVTTDNVTNITSTTATSGGNVTSDGGASVTARGICWSSSSNPTTSDNHTTDGSGTGTFSSNITGLTPTTQYYVRAYATNSIGTSYGNEVIFTTLAILPTVTTDVVTNITTTTATSGGNVTSDGGADVTARGVCWSTSSNPTTSDSYTTDGSGTGAFVSNITGLTSETLYYCRAYATNSIGIAYGNEVSFETLDTTPCDGQTSFIYEGLSYNIIEIEYQCWMKENLNYQTGNSWCYNNDPAYCITYGRLYDWATIMNGESSSNSVPSGVQGICPSSWHLPSDEEWKILEGNTDTQYGVGDSEWDGVGYRGYDAGKRLKTTTGWSLNTGTNAVGFSALPGGYRTSGSFAYLGYYGRWWSSTASGSATSWYRELAYNNNKANRNNTNKVYGFSVRCLKD